MNNHGRALETGAKNGSAAVSRKTEASSSKSPDPKTFFNFSEGLYL